MIAYASGAFGGGNATAGAGQADNAFPTSLATVTRRSLTSQTQVSATLGYAAPTSVVVPAGTTPQELAQATAGGEHGADAAANGAGRALHRHRGAEPG